MNTLIQTFPREIGLPYRILCKTREEFLKIIDNNNGYKPVCAGLYECDNDAKYEHSIIDKIFFDSDKPDLENITKLHVWAKTHNYRHIMFFSGNGTHFYLFAKNGVNLKCNKRALANAQKAICKELDLKIGDKKTDDIDTHLVGNIAGLGRIPNTYNTRRKRYCIPISEKEMEQGYDHIKEIAKKQNFHFTYYGKELFDIGEYDIEVDSNKIKPNMIDVCIKEEIDADKTLRELPLCISALLKKGDCGYRERYLIIMYLRERGYVLSETIEILRKFLTPAKFHHCMFEEHQPAQIYNRTELFFPSCDKLRYDGYCIKGCKEKIRLYL